MQQNGPMTEQHGNRDSGPDTLHWWLVSDTNTCFPVVIGQRGEESEFVESVGGAPMRERRHTVVSDPSTVAYRDCTTHGSENGSRDKCPKVQEHMSKGLEGRHA